MTDEPVRLATRGSRLAIAQTEAIKRDIEAHRRAVELVEVSTTGDELDEELIHELGTTGAFVRALDEEVLEGRVHGAVHSMKDIPTDQHPKLVIAAIPPRGSTEDVLITPDGRPLDELDEGSVVGTASLRRRAQLLMQRPDLEVEPIRGNIDTRLVKLYAANLARDTKVAGPEQLLDRAAERDVDTEYDAIVLARVGLERAGFEKTVAFDSLKMLTAAGQGAIAVTTLDDEFGAWLNDTIDDPRSRVETTVERRILATLGGGCVAPIAISAIIQDAHVQVNVQVLNRDGTDYIEAGEQLPVAEHVEAAEVFAQTLIDRGADELIEDAKRDIPGPRHRGDG